MPRIIFSAPSSSAAGISSGAEGGGHIADPLCWEVPGCNLEAAAISIMAVFTVAGQPVKPSLYSPAGRNFGFFQCPCGFNNGDHCALATVRHRQLDVLRIRENGSETRFHRIGDLKGGQTLSLNESRSNHYFHANSFSRQTETPKIPVWDKAITRPTMVS